METVNRHVIYINFDEQPTKEKLWQEFIMEGRFLTRRDIDIFYFLYENQNQIVTKKLLVDKVLGFGQIEGMRWRIRSIRKKIKNSNYQIKTYPGVGYKLNVID